MTGRPKRPVVLRPLARLTGRDAVWSVIRDLSGGAGLPFTVRDIARRIQGGRDMIRDYLAGLVTAGIVEHATPAMHRQGATYRLLRDMGVEAPRLTRAGAIDDTPTDQERMWQAMKAMPSFAVADIMVCTGIASVRTVRHYIRDLTRAGYLAPLHRASTTDTARYRLLTARNTGPRPPAVRRSGAVIDLNLGRQVWPAVAP